MEGSIATLHYDRVMKVLGEYPRDLFETFAAVRHEIEKHGGNTTRMDRIATDNMVLGCYLRRHELRLKIEDLEAEYSEEGMADWYSSIFTGD